MSIFGLWVGRKGFHKIGQFLLAQEGIMLPVDMLRTWIEKTGEVDHAQAVAKSKVPFHHQGDLFLSRPHSKSPLEFIPGQCHSPLPVWVQWTSSATTMVLCGMAAVKAVPCCNKFSRTPGLDLP